ncbi:MAG: GNAT family N-acetyltransferase [Alphaproteobacteria bacterium]|nr:GNAT family N-acetyltransferase [Alphaproteobacteria bacterium]
MMKAKIDLLINHEDLIPIVAQWYLAAFGTKETTIEQCKEILKSRLNTDGLNCCLLAFIEGEVVGTVSLTANDIPTKPELSPCVTHLFVSERYRCQNIGQSLVEYAKQKSKDMNFKKAYLYTTNETIHKWYGKLGWKIIGEGISNGFEIKIMERKL